MKDDLIIKGYFKLNLKESEKNPDGLTIFIKNCCLDKFKLDKLYEYSVNHGYTLEFLTAILLNADVEAMKFISSFIDEVQNTSSKNPDYSENIVDEYEGSLVVSRLPKQEGSRVLPKAINNLFANYLSKFPIEEVSDYFYKLMYVVDANDEAYLLKMFEKEIKEGKDKLMADLFISQMSNASRVSNGHIGGVYDYTLTDFIDHAAKEKDIDLSYIFLREQGDTMSETDLRKLVQIILRSDEVIESSEEKEKYEKEFMTNIPKILFVSSLSAMKSNEENKVERKSIMDVLVDEIISSGNLIAAKCLLDSSINKMNDKEKLAIAKFLLEDGSVDDITFVINSNILSKLLESEKAIDLDSIRMELKNKQSE